MPLSRERQPDRRRRDGVRVTRRAARCRRRAVIFSGFRDGDIPASRRQRYRRPYRLFYHTRPSANASATSEETPDTTMPITSHERERRKRVISREDAAPDYLCGGDGYFGDYGFRKR